jgi:hypothetical protein
VKSAAFAESRLIIDEYAVKINNRSMNDGEQVLWSVDIKEGIWHPKIICSWTITNLRAMKFYAQQDKFITAGLAISDTVVMNQHRDSSGSRIGTYSYGRGVGVGVGSSTSKSMTFGDLVFFVMGVELIRFNGISDPQGVRRMIESVKKQGVYYMKITSVPAITMTSVPVITMKCTKCGEILLPKQAFCSACGTKVGNQQSE